MNLNHNKYYNKWFKSSWTYLTGAIFLSLLQILTLAITGEPWKITSAFPYWGSWLLKPFKALGISGTFSFLTHPVSIRNLGIIAGALLATLMASQFKFRRIRSPKQVLAAALGGLLMGYGSRIAAGCNIGALYGGIASLSLSGWVFALFLFLGTLLGSKLLLRFFM